MKCRNHLRILAVVSLEAAFSSTGTWAQSPSEELDQHWVDACAAAVPGTPFYDRCQEILNAGPGSGSRRSAAAIGNNLETAAAAGRGREETHAGNAHFALQGDRYNLFVSGSSGWEIRPVSALEQGFDSVNQAILGGIDYLFTQNIVGGLAVTYSARNVSLSRGVGEMQHRDQGVFGFLNYTPARPILLESYVGYRRLRNKSSRSIDYVITLNRGLPTEETVRITSLATAGVRGEQFEAGGTLSLDIPVRALSIGPFVGVEYLRRALDPYREIDEVGLAVRFDEQAIRSAVALSGVAASLTLSREWGVLIHEIRGEYLHEFADDERGIGAHFAEDPSNFRFTIRTDTPDRDFFLFTGSIVASVPGGFSGYLTFRSSVGNRQSKDQLVSAGLRASL